MVVESVSPNPHFCLQMSPWSSVSTSNEDVSRPSTSSWCLRELGIVLVTGSTISVSSVPHQHGLAAQLEALGVFYFFFSALDNLNTNPHRTLLSAKKWKATQSLTKGCHGNGLWDTRGLSGTQNKVFYLTLKLMLFIEMIWKHHFPLSKS